MQSSHYARSTPLVSSSLVLGVICVSLLILHAWTIRNHNKERQTVIAALIARNAGQFASVHNIFEQPKKGTPVQDDRRIEPIGGI